jgi:signal transduction histidine kinase
MTMSAEPPAPPSPGDEPFASPILVMAIGIVVIATLGWNVIMGPRARAIPLAALGTAYLMLCTVGWAWCERRGGRAIVILLAAMAVAAVAILWVSQVTVTLIFMPLLLFLVLYTSTQWAILVTLVMVACGAAVTIDAHLPLVDIYAKSTDFVPGAIMTIVFSRVLLGERRARQEVRRYAAQVQELAATGERNRIAREIHDSVGHYLTVVNVQIEAARAIVSRDPAAADECLGRAQDLARDGLSELRRSVSMLRAGPLAQRPFGVALAGLVDACKRAGLDASLAIEGAARPLTPAVEFTLYRAAQEALTNIERHAHATRARAVLRYDPGQVHLRIEDDGVGATSTDGGFGLVGLRERAALVGGAVDVRTAPGGGFTIDVRVPT